MEQHWLIVERKENWETDRANGFSFFGLSPRYKWLASEIKEGDKVYCYVSSRISALSDIRVVRAAGIKKIKEDSFEDVYDRNFAYRIATSPELVLPSEKWVPLKQLMSVLELTKGRSAGSCRALFQTSIRRLTPADGSAITDAMRHAAAN